MNTQLFHSIFTTASTTITLGQFFLTFGVSLGLGILLAVVSQYRAQYSKEFVVTLALLPTLIALIIFLVNGNLGTSVAVAGAFSLIRFRSAAGSAKELLAVFLATAIGLATGMGYVLLAGVVTVLLLGILLVFERFFFRAGPQTSRYLILVLDQAGVDEAAIQDILGASCKEVELLSLQYKKKKEALVLEYQLTLTAADKDHQLLTALLALQPKDVTLHRQVPKMKRL